MATYPSTLPGPLLNRYSVEKTLALSTVRFEAGNTRRRRTASKAKFAFTLSFQFTTQELWAWQSWANQYGYDWHLMNLITEYSALSVSEDADIPHVIRYTSPITIDEMLDFGRVKVSVAAEMDVTTIPQGALQPSGVWYIAGTPSSPAPDKIIAGSHSAPSANVIIAGSPANPAA